MATISQMLKPIVLLAELLCAAALSDVFAATSPGGSLKSGVPWNRKQQRVVHSSARQPLQPAADLLEVYGSRRGPDGMNENENEPQLVEQGFADIDMAMADSHLPPVQRYAKRVVDQDSRRSVAPGLQFDSRGMRRKAASVSKRLAQMHKRSRLLPEAAVATRQQREEQPMLLETRGDIRAVPDSKKTFEVNADADFDDDMQRAAGVASLLAEDAEKLKTELQVLRDSRVLETDSRGENSGSQSSQMMMTAAALSSTGSSTQSRQEAERLAALEELEVDQEPAPAPAAPAPTTAAEPAPAPAAPAPAPAPAANATAGPATAEAPQCGGPDQVECSQFNKIFTINYKFTMKLAILHWVIVFFIWICVVNCFCRCISVSKSS